MKPALSVLFFPALALVACNRESTAPNAIPREATHVNDIVTAVSGFTTLSTNIDNTCILDASGRAYCAGYGGRGAVGYGGAATFIVDPYPVSGSLTFTTITSGSLHTCALTSTGQAYCWGSNEKGELAAATPKQCLVATVPCALAPTPVATNLRFTQIDGGNQFTCALDANGRAYCWGDNTFGQLGDGTTLSRTTPVPVAGGLSFVSVRAGGFHSCGLTNGGDLYCWGNNAQGQLGAVSANQCVYFQSYPCSTTPIRVATLRFLTMDTGTLHTCGVDLGGKGYCWGNNSYGQLGDGGLANQPLPTPVAGSPLFAHIAGGAQASCAIDAAGVGYCWGKSFGRSPVLIGGGFKWKVLLPHGDHRCGLALDGSPFCWGLEQYGELGNGGQHQEQFTTPQLMAPPHVIDLPPVAKIVVTGCVNLACTFNGSYSTDDFGVVSWNWDFGDGTTGTGAIANHTFPQSGTYTVRLTVFDARQQSNSTATAVQVYYQPPPPPVNQPPIASFTYSCIPRTPNVGSDCTFNSSASVDPDGNIVSRTWTVPGRVAKTGVTVTYPFPAGSTPTVTLTVTDNLGAVGTKSLTLTIP